KITKNHSPIIIMTLGSIFIFFSNIFLKQYLTPKDYGGYSLFITYISLINSFGLLGFEQVFLRISNKKDKGVIETNKLLLILICTLGLVFGLVCSLIFRIFFLKINYFLIFGCTIGISFSMFMFNIFRLNSDFLIAQVLYNGWKLFLGLFVFVLICFNIKIELINVILVLFISLSAVIITSHIGVNKNIRWELGQNTSLSTIIKYSFHFFISLLTLSVIGNADKFYIEKQFGMEILGDYFYLANLFIFPFSLLQGYVGFKELVFFKENFDLKIFNKKSTRINLLGIGLAILLIIINLLFFQFNYISVDLFKYKTLIFLFLITGILKLNYAIQSSAFGAVGEIKTIRKANIQSIFVISCIVFLFYFLIGDKLILIEYIAFVIMLFWLSRILIWNFNIRNQIYK